MLVFSSLILHPLSLGRVSQLNLELSSLVSLAKWLLLSPMCSPNRQTTPYKTGIYVSAMDLNSSPYDCTPDSLC